MIRVITFALTIFFFNLAIANTLAQPESILLEQIPPNQNNPEVIDLDKILQSKREIIVAIDAGHGGEDHGAVGIKGTKEKIITLAIAKRVAYHLQKNAGIKIFMVRQNDRYISLRDRIIQARQKSANLFVSIHADSFKEENATGSAVYILSETAASSEAARWLAEQENRSDLIGGISLDDKDSLLASVLLDLSQTATNDASMELARVVLQNMGQTIPLHGEKVQKANFAVLKSPDIPSILIETDFISNPYSETKLVTKEYQEKIARGIARGIQAYLMQTPIAVQNIPDLFGSGVGQ